MSELVFGTQLGNYLIEGELGRGGMGIVYRAQDLALKRHIALKVLAPHLLDDSTARTRFQREIKHAVAIEHPHVVPVYDAGVEEGYFYLAMRYVRGPDLWHIVAEEGPLAEARALRLIGQVASALSAVHEQGIVHRDVKPQNVLVWNSGALDEHAFLTDFGVARALGEVLRLTRAGALGTPGYMAPELLDGHEPTPACDQFSLACLAFELLTGELPFGDGTTEGGTSIDPFSKPLPLAFYGPRISKRVRETVERALSPNPGERFPDVRAFVMADEALQAAFEQSRAITDVVQRTRTDSELVTGLSADHRLSDSRIAEIADLERSEVVKLRRKAARRSLIGE
jgi:serine/threonine protein kinase